jgi:hypothetical protein
LHHRHSVHSQTHQSRPETAKILLPATKTEPTRRRRRMRRRRRRMLVG